MSIFRVKDNKHKSYQLYDKITLEEADEAAREKLPDISKDSLYQIPKKTIWGKVFHSSTAHDEEKGQKRLFFTRVKDYPTNNTTIRLLKSNDLYDEKRKSTGYYHVAAVQVLIKWLGNAGIDIPIQIAFRDERISDPEKSIIGLMASNLRDGSLYTVLYLDLTFSALDGNINDALTLYVKPSIDMKEKSYAISVSTRIYLSWSHVSQSYRKKDEMFNELSRGKTTILKGNGNGIDKSSIPRPIPVNELTYDTSFDFERPNHVNVESTSQVEYKLSTKDHFHVKLAAPSSSNSRSTRFSNLQFDNILGKEDSDDE